MTSRKFRESQGVSIPEWNDIIDKMLEAYHKAKVEAISDEEIAKAALEHYEDFSDEYYSFILGANFVKNND